MSTSSRTNASLSPWSIHDNVRTASAKGDESPSVKAINFKDTDMGMTTTLTTRDLSDANYPEFVVWVQDILQACWSVAGKNYKPVFELLEHRVFEVINAFSLGHLRSVITEVIRGPEWTHKCYAFLKKTARDKKRAEEFKNASKESGKAFEKRAPASTSPKFLYAIGNGDVWLLLELIMTRYLGRNV